MELSKMPHDYRRALIRILTVLKESELSQTLHIKESPLNKDQVES